MTMRERPILFNAPMVRAILDGRKTQTRRPVKPQPVMQDGWVGGAYWQPKKSPAHGFPERFCIRDIVAMCPLGQPGDRLWVRETFIERSGDLFYRADGESRSESAYIVCFGERIRRWTPSIHMPRWASRITLEITDVRVQRVQDISPNDAIAEGLDRVNDGAAQFGVKGLATSWRNDPCEAFECLWNNTYGPDAWHRNDWVWAVRFKRVTP